MSKGIYVYKPLSKETRMKLSRIAKEREYGKWMIGKKRSEETKRKISEARKGHLTSEETRRKIGLANSIALRGTKKSFRTEEHIKKLSEKNSIHWKGDKVGYAGLHIWIKKQFGKASKCVVCDSRESRTYNWANISGEHRRDMSDYIQLCVSCHRKYDLGRKKFNLQKFVGIIKVDANK